jgi:multiple sugar transport system substrate-binding protein
VHAAVRSLGGILAVVVLAAGVAGCTSDAQEPDPDPSAAPAGPSKTVDPTDTPEPSAEPEEVTLRLSVYGDRHRVRAYRDIVEEFVDARPEITVEIETHDDAGSSAEATVQELESGGEAPDVFLADDAYLPQLVATGRVQPVDDLFEDRGLQFGDDYQRVALTSFSADSRLQCMPAEMSPRIVYFNRGLLPRAQLEADGVVLPFAEQTSWSWADFTATARAMAGVDRFGEVKGVYIPPDVGTLTAFLRSGGGDVVDATFNPSTLTLASDEARETIAEVAGLARDAGVSLTPEELAERDAVARFTRGELGMLVGTRADLPRIRTNEELRFDVFPLPSIGRARSTATINGLCIDAETEHLDAALDLVQFAVGPVGSEIAAASGGFVPASLDTLDTDAFRQPDQLPRGVHVFATSNRRSEPMPYATAWPEVSAMVEEAMGRLYTRPWIDFETTLERRMERLDTRSEELFAEDDDTTG